MKSKDTSKKEKIGEKSWPFVKFIPKVECDGLKMNCITGFENMKRARKSHHITNLIEFGDTPAAVYKSNHRKNFKIREKRRKEASSAALCVRVYE